MFGCEPLYKFACDQQVFNPPLRVLFPLKQSAKNEKTTGRPRKSEKYSEKNKENQAALAFVQRSTIFGTVQEQPNGDVVLPAGMLETIEKSFNKLPESMYLLPKFNTIFLCMNFFQQEFCYVALIQSEL